MKKLQFGNHGNVLKNCIAWHIYLSQAMFTILFYERQTACSSILIISYGSGSQSMGREGSKMGCAKVIEICQNKLFSFHISSSFNFVID